MLTRKNKLRTVAAAHLELGLRGERLALEYLKSRGYRIVATNYLIPLGRALGGQRLTGEIDIIAYDWSCDSDGGSVPDLPNLDQWCPTLVFIEVKTRRSDDFAAPERAVDLRKQRQIARTARRYRRFMNVAAEPYRYDVVTVIAGQDRTDIQLLKGYFDDGIFRRARFFRQP